MCYMTGRGVPEDQGEAVKWFRKAAEQDVHTGQVTHFNKFGKVW